MEKLKPAAAQNARKTEKGTPYFTSRFRARGLARNNSLHNDYESDVLLCDKHVKYLMDLLQKNMVSHALNWVEECVRVQDVSLRSRWSQSQWRWGQVVGLGVEMFIAKILILLYWNLSIYTFW